VPQVPPFEVDAMRHEDDTAVEILAARALRRWRDGEHLSTLDLRAAWQAADRQFDDSDAREIAGELEVREAKGQTG
jgi:hypothetical protein